MVSTVHTDISTNTEKIIMNSSSVQSLNDSVVISDIGHVIRIIIIAIITILIFVTNGIIAAVLYSSTTLTYTTTYLVGSLCASDMLTGLLFLCNLISAFKGKWAFSQLTCAIASVMFLNAIGITLMTLSMLLIDKYILLRFPLRYHNIMNRKKIAFIVMAIWMMSIVWSVAGDIILNYQHQYSKITYMCYVEPPNTSDRRNAVILGTLTMVPVIVIYMYCNIKIYRICHNQQNRVNIETEGIRNSKTSMNIKGLKTILLTSLVSFTSWTPFCIIRMAIWLSLIDPPPVILFMAFLCVFCTSFSNWIIYTRTHTPYANEQRKLWKSLKSWFFSKISSTQLTLT